MQSLIIIVLLIFGCLAHGKAFDSAACSAALVRLKVLKTNADLSKDDRAFCQVDSNSRKISKDTCEPAEAAARIQKAFLQGKANAFMDACRGHKAATLSPKNRKVLDDAWFLIESATAEQWNNENIRMESGGSVR